MQRMEAGVIRSRAVEDASYSSRALMTLQGWRERVSEKVVESRAGCSKMGPGWNG
jgi:hypothetical protein